MARKPLGRGLGALLGETRQEADASSVREIDIELIDPNPEQPRTRFAEKALEDLAQSIRENGIVQPVVVRPNGARYQIVAGERRWRAAQRAGLRKLPAVTKEVSDDKLLELALIENIQRQELNPMEEARAYRKLIDSIGLTQEMVAQRVGRDRTLITTSLRLLKLPEDIQKLIEEEKLSAGHGRALLLADDPAVQRRVARAIIDGSMSVRESERAVKRAASQRETIEKKAVTAIPDPNIRAAEEKLMRRFSSNVRILPKQGGKGGKIEIEYYSMEDLDRVFQLLMKQEN